MSDKPVYVPSSALDSFSHALYAERLPEIGTREPYLMVGLEINKNKPQYSTASIKAVHFIRGEERNKAFEVKTKPQYIQAALQQLIAYARKPYGGNRELTTWEIKSNKIVGGQMTQEKITAGKIVVGRTEKGPFISVVHWSDKYPSIPFFPGLHDPNALGVPTDDPERTYNFVCSNAIGWATTISDLLSSEYSRGQNAVLDNMRRNQPAPAQGGGGSYGGGGNYGGGKSYGGNSGGANYGESQSVTRTTSDDGSGFNF